MKFWKAMKALEEGKKVRSKDWPQTQWVEKSDMADAFGRSSVDEWELYEELEQLFTFMQVVEGLKQGKKFKRKIWGNWYLAFSHSVYIQGVGLPCDFSFYKIEDFEATDWVEVR